MIPLVLICVFVLCAVCMVSGAREMQSGGIARRVFAGVLFLLGLGGMAFLAYARFFGARK
jgi:hypothetical protein